MQNLKISSIRKHSYQDFSASGIHQSDDQRKASRAILSCKSANLGINISQCQDCGHLEFHYNSCRNRNCPNCQAVNKEIWGDKRRAEVIDAPYFHVVFTLPHELNPLLYCNQRLLYALLHRCCAQTLLELSASKKWLGATPGIIQVLPTWNQELGYHVHMHCIISGDGLTKDHKIRKTRTSFFIPVRVLRDKFKGKYLAELDSLYKNQKLVFSNAIEYLGRYTHKVAISNHRILSVAHKKVTFSARGRKPGDPHRIITLDHTEFIRRYLMHVLPSGFQKIRYYGFLNNRARRKNLKLIFTLQGHQRFHARYAGLSMAELLKTVWKVDICICPECGCHRMRSIGRTYGTS